MSTCRPPSFPGNEAVPAAAALLVAVRDLIRRAREAGALVVQLQNDGLPGTADEPHTPGWELFLPVAGDNGQRVIRKDTDRDKILTAQDAKDYGIIDTVLEYRKLSAATS